MYIVPGLWRQRQRQEVMDSKLHMKFHPSLKGTDRLSQKLQGNKTEIPVAGVSFPSCCPRVHTSPATQRILSARL